MRLSVWDLINRADRNGSGYLPGEALVAGNINIVVHNIEKMQPLPAAHP
jgi:hypothetical protein